MGGTYLWWIGEGDADEAMMDRVCTHVERVFVVPVTRWRAPERPTEGFDAARGQHSSTRILRWVLASQPPAADKLLAVTDVDLFIPVLTFVFGEAQLDGVAALVSTARLRWNLDGALARRRLLLARLEKECVHELGHAFGLIHCADRRCVMARAASIANVDAKTSRPCATCQLRLEELQQQRSERDD